MADDDLRAGRNPIHTAIFGVLALGLVGVLPLAIGGFAGLLIAPVAGTALFGLYTVTLPRGPRQPAIDETAGSQACPACGSMQTDHRRFRSEGEPRFQCFACKHEW